MAVVKPLIMDPTTGRFRNIQPGETLGATGTNTVAGNASSALIAGAPVYLNGSNSVQNAQANNINTSQVLGLSQGAVSSGAAATVLLNEVLSLTTGQWDAVAGTTGGLSPGALYYLSPTTPGRLTATCPNTAGQLVVIIGQALNTTDLNVDIRDPVLI